MCRLPRPVPRARLAGARTQDVETGARAVWPSHPQSTRSCRWRSVCWSRRSSSSASGTWPGGRARSIRTPCCSRRSCTGRIVRLRLRNALPGDVLAAAAAHAAAGAVGRDGRGIRADDQRVRGHPAAYPDVRSAHEARPRGVVARRRQPAGNASARRGTRLPLPGAHQQRARQGGQPQQCAAHTSAEYIAIFDADHAPAPSFLEETLGFFSDERVAFVQTPQDFYNLDSFQHRFDRRDSLVWSEQTLFFRVIQAGKDRLNSAFFCGSCAVIRRQALDDIGGFATGSVPRTFTPRSSCTSAAGALSTMRARWRSASRPQARFRS